MVIVANGNAGTMGKPENSKGSTVWHTFTTGKQLAERTG
jgi:hypothetical protein